MPKALAATKHFKIAGYLRRVVRARCPGDAVPTFLELRQRFGVSQATVERALERLRKEGLIERRDGQKRPVVASAHPAARRVVLIRPEYPSLSFEALCRVVIEAGRPLDWAFDLVAYRRLAELKLREVIGEADAAILLPSSEAFPPDLLAALRRPRVPITIIQEPPPGLRVSSVRLDDRQAGHLAVQYLQGLGHRRILLFQNEPLEAASSAERAGGWEQQMLAAGEVNLQELIVDASVKPSEDSMLRAYRRFSKWLDGPQPQFTAIFCPALSGALAVLRALREHHVEVPSAVSVICHGGESSMAQFAYPPLTAIEADFPAYGRAVVKLLTRQLEHPSAPVRAVTIPARLVIRESTAECTVLRAPQRDR